MTQKTGIYTNCKQCNKSIYVTRGAAKKRQNHFCSQTCSAKYNNAHRAPMTSKQKQQISDTLRKFHGLPTRILTQPIMPLEHRLSKSRAHREGKIMQKEYTCKVCNQLFISHRQGKAYFPTVCSDECRGQQLIKNAHGCRYIYKNTHMQSSWEVSIAKFLDEQGIEWVRPKCIPYKYLDGKMRNYFADFFIPSLNLYVDPKNPIIARIQKDKLLILEKQIDLIYGTVDFLKQEILKRVKKMELGVSAAPTNFRFAGGAVC